MRARALLEVEYLTPAELARHRSRGWEDVLGIAHFAEQDSPVDAKDVPIAQVMTKRLNGQSSICEIWRAAGPFRTGNVGLVHYRANDHVAFGRVSLHESSAAVDREDGAALKQITQRAYSEMFACVLELGFSHLLRIWNYLPEINRESGGIERYRQFNEARQRSFQSFHRDVRRNVPAACALGSEAGSPLVVYFIAGAEPSLAIENPRQRPAYDYPPQYGQFAPTFSRATLSRAATLPMLFMSGTASIVGHRTLHVGDVRAQTRETLKNISSLVAEANRATGSAVFAPEKLRYKVYLRRPGDLEDVADEFSHSLAPATPIVWLQADVCRTELLIEVEATGIGDQPDRQ